MADTETREKLMVLLDTLKRNLAVVSREVLKTKYKKPYDVLAKDICATATAYVEQTALQGIYIRKEYFSEVKQLIESASRQSGLLKEISRAAFIRQDIGEIDTLTLSLRKLVNETLEGYYARHMGWYLADACFEEPPGQPLPYNPVTDSVLEAGVWKSLWKKKINPCSFSAYTT